MDGVVFREYLDREPLEQRIRLELGQQFSDRALQVYSSNPEIHKKIKDIAFSNIWALAEIDLHRGKITQKVYDDCLKEDLSRFPDEAITEYSDNLLKAWMLGSEGYEAYFEQVIQVANYESDLVGDKVYVPKLNKIVDKFLASIKTRELVVNNLLAKNKNQEYESFMLTPDQTKSAFQKVFSNKETYLQCEMDNLEVAKSLLMLMNEESDIPQAVAEDYHKQKIKLFYDYFVKADADYLFD